MSEKGFVSIESFLDLQERLGKAQCLFRPKDPYNEWYYDSRIGWIKKRIMGLKTYDGSATSEELERNFEIFPSIRLDNKPQT